MQRLLVLAAFALTLSAPALAQDTSARVAARLVAEQASAKPGGTVTLGLEQVIREHWHTYWVNPGDVGIPTSIDWTLPEGWTAGSLQWATPKRLPVATFMDYGYEGKVWLLSDIAVPASARPGDVVELKGVAHFLVCEQVCIPEDAALSVTLKVGDGSNDPAAAKDFAAARAALPVASPWKMVSARAGKSFDLFVEAPALAAARPTASFFPLKPAVIKGTAPQTTGFVAGGLVQRLPLDDKFEGGTAPLEGVLVLTSTDGSVQALSVSAPAGTVPAADFASAPAPAPQNGMTLLVAILSAFLGGLILNAMPCVLPILAMKALALASHGDKHNNDAAREGFSYAAGAVLSFLAFGLAIVALRAGGDAVGWGFQLQQPMAVAGFALLTFGVGLNLSGLFEFGSVTAGGDLAARSGPMGAFFTGVLAVAVAAPCTAPFMAAALGFALTQSAGFALLIFLGLGLGFAFPFMILGLYPRALSFLPRPGPWMLRLKQFLAFPMYGAAAWLAWVLALQAGANGVAVLLAAGVTLALAAWLWSVTRDLQTRGRLLGTVCAAALLLAVLYGLSTLSGASNAAPATAALGSEKFSEAKLASLRAEGRPVFLDATAAWCITCLVNEKAVLSRDSVKQAFADKNIAYVVADWTNRDDAITKLLQANGRDGVPLYLYYAKGSGKPVVLPQILTEALVLDAIKD